MPGPRGVRGMPFFCTARGDLSRPNCASASRTTAGRAERWTAADARGETAAASAAARAATALGSTEATAPTAAATEMAEPETRRGGARCARRG